MPPKNRDQTGRSRDWLSCHIPSLSTVMSPSTKTLFFWYKPFSPSKTQIPKHQLCWWFTQTLPSYSDHFLWSYSFHIACYLFWPYDESLWNTIFDTLWDSIFETYVVCYFDTLLSNVMFDLFSIGASGDTSRGVSYLGRIANWEFLLGDTSPGHTMTSSFWHLT